MKKLYYFFVINNFYHSVRYLDDFRDIAELNVFSRDVIGQINVSKQEKFSSWSNHIGDGKYCNFEN